MDLHAIPTIDFGPGARSKKNGELQEETVAVLLDEQDPGAFTATRAELCIHTEDDRWLSASLTAQDCLVLARRLIQIAIEARPYEDPT